MFQFKKKWKERDFHRAASIYRSLGGLINHTIEDWLHHFKQSTDETKKKKHDRNRQRTENSAAHFHNFSSNLLGRSSKFVDHYEISHFKIQVNFWVAIVFLSFLPSFSVFFCFFFGIKVLVKCSGNVTLMDRILIWIRFIIASNKTLPIAMWCDAIRLYLSCLPLICFVFFSFEWRTRARQVFSVVDSTNWIFPFLFDLSRNTKE